MKAGNRTYKDYNDVYWFVKDGDDATGYDLFYADSAAAAKLGVDGAKDKNGNECHALINY